MTSRQSQLVDVTAAFINLYDEPEGAADKVPSLLAEDFVQVPHMPRPPLPPPDPSHLPFPTPIPFPTPLNWAYSGPWGFDVPARHLALRNVLR